MSKAGAEYCASLLEGLPGDTHPLLEGQVVEVDPTGALYTAVQTPIESAAGLASALQEALTPASQLLASVATAKALKAFTELNEIGPFVVREVSPAAARQVAKRLIEYILLPTQRPALGRHIDYRLEMVAPQELPEIVIGRFDKGDVRLYTIISATLKTGRRMTPLSAPLAVSVAMSYDQQSPPQESTQRPVGCTLAWHTTRREALSYRQYRKATAAARRTTLL